MNEYAFLTSVLANSGWTASYPSRFAVGSNPPVDTE